jgi:prepilin-type N-terminal cleavage/methylation domain-containing protein
MRTRRSGFTLIEIIVVLIIFAVMAGAVMPALLRFGEDEDTTAYAGVRKLLRDAQRTSAEHGVPVRVIIDPEKGDYRADTVGANGTGVVLEGNFSQTGSVTMESDSSRVRFTFLPSGIAFGDSLIVHTGTASVKLTVDPLTGALRVTER